MVMELCGEDAGLRILGSAASGGFVVGAVDRWVLLLDDLQIVWRMGMRIGGGGITGARGIVIVH